MAAAPFTPENAEEPGGIPHPMGQRLGNMAAEAAGAPELRRERLAQEDAATKSWAPLPPLRLAGLVLLVDALALVFSPVSVFAALRSLGEAVTVPGEFLAFSAALTLALGACRGAYGRCVLRAAPEQLAAILPAAAVSWVISVLAATFNEWGALPSYAWAPAYALASLGALAAGRVTLAAVLQGPTGECFAPRTLIVSDGSSILPLAEHIRKQGGDRLRLFGVVSEDTNAIHSLHHAGVPCLGRLEAALVALRSGQVEQVILPAHWALDRSAASILPWLVDVPFNVNLAAGLNERSGDAHSRIDLLRLQERQIAGWRAVIKSALDYSAALVAVTIATLPMLLIALAIQFESPGPVLFRQRRTGFNGRDFRILKFRTMYHHVAGSNARRQVVSHHGGPSDPPPHIPRRVATIV